MVRSQTRPALEPQPEPEEVVHPAFLNAVLAGWWKKPEPEVVIVEAPLPPTATPEEMPQQIRIETRTIYRAPRWVELTLVAGIGVILCLQVALLVSH